MACVPDGEAGLRWLARESVDLVLTDVMMPAMDGLAMARAIRREEHLAAIPILAMSAVPHLVDRAEAELFDAIIQKPFLGAELLDRIKALLVRRTGAPHLKRGA